MACFTRLRIMVTTTKVLPYATETPASRAASLVALLPVLVPCVTAFGLLLFLAAPMLRWWHWEFTRPESYYGHGYAIPALAALMLWHRRDALRKARISPVPAALLVLLPALLILSFSVENDMQALMSWSFLAALNASVWFIAGGRFFRAALAPLLFLCLMAPLPGPLLNDMTLGMQSLSTAAAAKTLNVIGFHGMQTGNVIYLENYTLNVGLPCSGFHLLLRLLAFSAAFALLTDTDRGRKLTLLLLSVPLALAINAFRIASIGVVGECLGASAAETFHDWGGLFSLVMCMWVLFGSAKLLRCKTFVGQPIF